MADFWRQTLLRGASLSAGDAFVAAFGRRNGNVFGQVSGKRVCGQRGATRGDAMMYRQGRWRKSRGTVRSACDRRDGPVAGRSCAEIPQNVPACGEGRDGRSAGQEQHERRGSIRQLRKRRQGRISEEARNARAAKSVAQGVARRPTAQRRRSGRRHEEDCARKAVKRILSVSRT